MSSDGCVKAAIKNVEIWLEKKGEKLKTKTACVFPSGWKHECDVTPLLNDEDGSCKPAPRVGMAAVAGQQWRLES